VRRIFTPFVSLGRLHNTMYDLFVARQIITLSCRLTDVSCFYTPTDSAQALTLVFPLSSCAAASR
jgi:hypothetical protein